MPRFKSRLRHFPLGDGRAPRSLPASASPSVRRELVLTARLPPGCDKPARARRGDSARPRELTARAGCRHRTVTHNHYVMHCNYCMRCYYIMIAY